MLIETIILLVLTAGLCVSTRPNILFIMSEDLRLEFGLKDSMSIVPNLDRLAKKSTSFDFAFCQVAVCAPSRASLLTGLRPETLGIYDFSHYGGLKHFRTIPSHFHRHGYQTASAGKLFHWDGSRFYSHNYWGSPQWEKLQKAELKFHNSSVTPDDVNRNEHFFRDSVIATEAIRFLEEMNRHTGEPWFLGVGFKGTHMQYQMPKSFWDKYNRTVFNAAAETLRFPADAPIIHHVKKTEGTIIHYMNQQGSMASVEREAYQRNGDGLAISERGWRELYRGYLACLSYADAQLGRILDVLDRNSLWNTTIVVFTSDHGMHVGEKGIWGKWTLFDESTRVPLLVHAPGLPQSYGRHYQHTVELVDIFPTLVDLSGVSLELSPEESRTCKGSISGVVPGEAKVRNAEGIIIRHLYCDPVDGTSLAPILRARSHDEVSTIVKPIDFALTQKMTCKMPGSVDIDPLTKGWTDFCPFKKLPRDPPLGAMGYAMRTVQWRYIAWLEFDTNTFLPSLHKPPLVEELYKHDLQQSLSRIGTEEIYNLALNPDFADIVSGLKRKLYDFLWQNSSFEHLFQKRCDQIKMRPIVVGRHHAGPHPHHGLHPQGHYFSHRK